MRDGEGRRARSRYGSSDPLLQRTRFDLYTIHAYIYIYTTRLHSTWYYLLNIIQYKAILTASTACPTGRNHPGKWVSTHPVPGGTTRTRSFRRPQRSAVR